MMTCTESPIAKSVAAVWFLIPFLFLLPDSGKSVSAADWPMWRHDAARSGASAAAFPDKLHLQWIRQLPEPMPAWPESQPKLNFDRYCQPVVSGQHLLLSSTVSESVCAFNTRTGRREWVFLTNGPVRFAPAIADGRVYVTSDDGYLYCLDLETGQRIWKVLGGPYAKQIIGNDRLISMWPCRGGVVVKDGMVCFAAGIWPSMGVFIRAVDAQSGKILWTNSTTGSKFVRHPHGADAFGSISPQGCLSISGNNLIVPGGRTLPGVFDLQTGEMRHFEFGGKGEGGHDVFVSGGLIHVRGEAFHVTDGQSVGNVPADFVGRGIVGLVNSKLIVTDPRGSIQEETVKDRKGKAVRKTTYRPLRRESFELAGPSQRIFMEAGAQVFAAEPGRIAAYRYTELPGRLQPHWTHSTDTPGSSGSSSQAVAMIAADDRLFVVMSDSRLLCFGPDKSGDPAQLDWQTGTGDPVAALPETVPLSVEPDRAGYAVSLVPPRQDTLHRLLNQTRMKLISYQRPESSPGVPAGQDFWTHDRYGDRFTFRSGQVDELEQPPYFASLVFCDVKKTYTAREIRTVFSMLRPYGGECRLAASQSTHQEIVGFTAGKSSATDVFQGAEITRDGEWTVIRRPGPLPDAGVWTHQYGDSANSVVSTDARVKAPLGLLWFGGPSNDRVLPRHGHGPSPQVAGGRLFIEGADMLRCVDVYTGRVWWERDLPGLGTYYNNTAHHPGAGEIGSNYVSLEDCVYVIHEQKLLALNVETGRTQFEFQHTGTSGVPAAENRWGALAVEGDLLVATASPVALVPDEKDGGSDTDKAGTDAVPGNTVAVIPPHSEWKYQAGPDPRNDWTNVSFDDAKWPRGSAGFGYGDKDDATVLKDMQNRYSRVYIRHEFQLPASIDAGELRQFGARLQLLLKYDDAFIAYLNGQEFARSGIGSGRGSLAKELSGHEAKRYDTFIPREGKTLIRPGKNVIAIEGHNSGIDSSDFTLDPFLVVSVDDDFRKVTAKLQPDAVEPPGKRSLLDMLLPAEYSSVSRLLSVFDRHTGRFHWSRAAKFGFRHNAICVAGDRLYCIDAFSPSRLAVLKRRGVKPQGRARLLCLNVKTGQEIWSTDRDVFGTFLSYSREYDMLIQAGSAYRDRAKDEVDTGLVAYDGRNGKVIWKDLEIKYGGPLLIHHDRLITNGGGGFEIDLKTGRQTGWKYSRMYGCNTAVGSEHLLTFRSGAAGFCDLTGDSGTGNLGGFRSSCTSNLIAADGVLNAPDYTRTCSCAYQLQTSLALVHMPEAESWTFGHAGHFSEPVKTVALNLGAPGDHRDGSGRLWFDYPGVGGPGPKIPAETEPEHPEGFEQHTSLMADHPLNRVGASGLTGLRKVSLNVKLPADTQSVDVQLVFALPPGETHASAPRVFSVSVNGNQVLRDFNLTTAGSPSGDLSDQGTRTVVHAATGVPCHDGRIEIELTPGDTSGETVLSGVLVTARPVR